MSGSEQSASLLAENDETVSLCSICVGKESFGIRTEKVREVLACGGLQCVPLSPFFIAGVVPYCGDVLTAVSLRTLLGLAEISGSSYVMVLEDEADGEHFGLIVDAVGGVVSANRRMHEANPSTLAARYRAFFDGAYKMDSGLMVQLDPHRLHPTRLAEAGVLGRRAREGADCG